jgi:hypothetical protein
MRSNLVGLAGLVALVAGAAGCKGKTEYKDSKQTQERLAHLEEQIRDKDVYIQKLRDQNAELQRDHAPSGGEWHFTIEGNALVLSGKPGGKAVRAIDDATATAMSEQFFDIVQRSRGSIQKCYEQALKRSSGLQSRPVDLKLSASFAASGAFSRVSFSPRDLPTEFDTCLRGVASRWKMPKTPQAMTFQASVKLTPT